jgi:hypothetical protein
METPDFERASSLRSQGQGQLDLAASNLLDMAQDHTNPESTNMEGYRSERVCSDPEQFALATESRRLF